MTRESQRVRRVFCLPACRSSGGQNARPTLAAAFTLVEMIVALFVLIIAMGVVSGVFAVSTRTAATSAALSETQTALRTLSDQIEEDLDGIDPTQSVLVIVGRVQAAALTQVKLDARQRWRVFVGDSTIPSGGYDPRFDTNPQNPTPGAQPADQYSDPRADILMFFTQRPMASKCPPSESYGPSTGYDARDIFRRSVARGSRISPAQVVYGHAAIGTATRTNGAWSFPAVGGNIRHIEQTQAGSMLSGVPASQWILGRRQALIDDVSTGIANLVNQTSLPPAFFALGGNGTLLPSADSSVDGDPSEYTRILRCYSGDGRASGADHFAGDTVTFRLADYLHYLSSLTAEGRRLISAYPYYGIPPAQAAPAGMPPTWSIADHRNILWGLLYPGGATGNIQFHHVGTALRDVPPELQSNLGLQALRGCAWFQVEFLLPEDPRNSWEGTPGSVAGQQANYRNDMPRWVEVPPGETYCFLPDTSENRALIAMQVDGNHGDALNPTQSPNFCRLNSFAPVVQPGAPLNGDNTAANRRVRLWPYAIRITIRAMDEKNKLDEPLVRTIVHRFD